jgi:hypothetical protein
MGTSLAVLQCNLRGRRDQKADPDFTSFMIHFQIEPQVSF